MVILNADHPDILDFVRCKADEEKKAWALIEAGYDAGFNVPGGAYDSVQFQNANHSVRVTDGFMRALEDDGDWTTHAVTDGRAMETMKAADLWKEMAEAAWVCGDPGVQFDSTIQSWNTVPNTGRINATNPCSEFVFVDDTACFAPETRISTPNGLRTVESLFRAQEGGERVLVTTELHSEHDHRRLTAHRPARVTKVGRKPVVKMTLADGRQVRVTGDHRFLTSDGWRRVDQLRIGQDRVELRQSGNAIAFNSSSEAVQRWRMFGWLTGDGVFNKDVVAFVFGPKERKQAMHVATNFNLLKAESAVGRPGLSLRESSVGTQANGVMQITCSRDSVVRTLEETYGFAQATAIDKDVPSEVHRVSEDLRVAYLQGLFSADGCIRYNRSGTEPEVMLASSSPRLLRSVQLMLSDLGITSRVRFTHPAGRKNPQGQLHIFNQQMRKFLALVGFPCSDEKRAMAGRVLNSAFAGVLKNPRASTVVSIEPDGIQMVYDVTEPITHSLIAEGMVAHNCNLLSLNLRKFQNQDATVNAERMKRAVDICFTAQEILVSNASYPTPRIAENSERLRPLGLGYANLGALLMSMGHAYDSPDGRAVAGAVTALMTGEAYAQSARMAEVKGPFLEFPKNREPMLGVMRKHQAAAKELPATGDAAPLADAAREAWADAITLGEHHGYRNAQASVIAPTGTIGLMMDCDTTGIEPDLALVKYKTLVGGGSLKIVNATVPTALSRLGYAEDEVRGIVAYIDTHDTIEGAPGLRAEDLPVFDCAFRPLNGKRSIAPMGHVRMMAAVQPFVSGSQSKTVNLPTDATAEDIAAVYQQSWGLGLKCIAIYRDGCKRSQPLSTSEKSRKEEKAQAGTAPTAAPVAPEPRPYRRRLPDERTAITHKFEIQGHEGYITVGMYPDGKPGEVFIKMAKEGSTISGLMDALATQTSVA
ncbi:MAG: intein-containing adenosylcobalamin-dependent ribonucleoside-diphosphate reductase, partial [Candidatus Dormibacteraeota bacterium]|nr:intein-containing adenosylcobalamin-dependent ribonucleoside-diphosphate reductase [Candidatus Dormibacteraeota bacterium]